MRVARSLSEVSGMLSSGALQAVTIGNFDGVHAGHRELIRVTREKAQLLGSLSVAITFDPHPVHVVRGVASPGLITPLPRKLELLDQAGLDLVLVLPFTRQTAAMTPDEFVKSVLVESVAAREVVVGYNFALGKNRSGTFATLADLGERYGFCLTQVPSVAVEGETVSSTLIREYITCGDMEKVSLLLGRMHSVDGCVVHGKARGRNIGFPTANVAFPEMLLPPLGGYATWFQILSGRDSPPQMSMTSVGTNPTFGGNSVTLESHLLDFSGDLYGKEVRLYFAKRLRGEIHFKSAVDLAERLGRDAVAAKSALEREAKSWC